MTKFKCTQCGSLKVSELKPINDDQFKTDEVNYFCWQCWSLTALIAVSEEKPKYPQVGRIVEVIEHGVSYYGKVHKFYDLYFELDSGKTFNYDYNNSWQYLVHEVEDKKKENC